MLESQVPHFCWHWPWGVSLSPLNSIRPRTPTPSLEAGGVDAMYIGQALWCCCVAQFCFQTDTTQTFSRALLSTCGSKVVHRPRWFWCFCSVSSYCKILPPANMIHLIPKKSWKPATNINKDSPTNSNALSMRTWHEHGAEAWIFSNQKWLSASPKKPPTLAVVLWFVWPRRTLNSPCCPLHHLPWAMLFQASPLGKRRGGKKEMQSSDRCLFIFWAQQSSVQQNMLPSKQLMSLLSDSQATLRCALLFGNYLLTSFDNDQGVPSVPVSNMASFEGSKSCPLDLPEKNIWAQSQSWAWCHVSPHAMPGWDHLWPWSFGEIVWLVSTVGCGCGFWSLILPTPQSKSRTQRPWSISTWQPHPRIYCWEWCFCLFLKYNSLTGCTGLISRDPLHNKTLTYYVWICLDDYRTIEVIKGLFDEASLLVAPWERTK